MKLSFLSLVLFSIIFSLSSCSSKDVESGKPDKKVKKEGQKTNPTKDKKTAEAIKKASKVQKIEVKHTDGHVPCGNHTGKSDGKLYPSVFAKKPPYGTKVSCPIKGETFEFSASRPFVEYKGKTYVFGCNGCKGIFLKDPEAALKKYKFLEAK